MKIYYFSIYDILRARTNQIADLRLCEGFTQNGCEVELIVPYVYREGNIHRDAVFETYGIETGYGVRILRTPFWEGMPAFLNIPLVYVYAFFTMLGILVSNRRDLSRVVLMSRSIDMLIPGILLKKLLRLRKGPLVVVWAHEIIFKKRYLWVYCNSDAVVGTNSVITEDLNAKVGIDNDRMEISLNPVSDHQLRNVLDRDAARRRLGLHVDRPLIVYTGKLYIGMNEAEYILQASALLPDYQFLLTGGKPRVIEHFRRECEQRGLHNVMFTGFLDTYEEVRHYQAAADVLVSYYSASDHLVRYNLPNKICEYMIAGKPIVSSDFPATRDVLSSSNAILVPAEKPESLAAGIREAVSDRRRSDELARRALQDVAGMTYLKRANVLKDFFEKVMRRIEAP